MAQYIEKSALVAEINNCIDRCTIKKQSCPVNTQVEAICDNKIHAYKEILSFIDTLASLQEEPAPKIFEDMLNAKTPAESLGISAEEHDKIIDLCLYGKEPEMVDIDDLPKEEPASEELKEAANNAVISLIPSFGQKNSDGSYVSSYRDCFKREEFINLFKAGAKWQKESLWKLADGDDLPEIDREVIALEGIIDPTATDCFCGYKVVFAHRPTPEGYDGKSITTGVVEHYIPETYGEGGWNVPNIAYWLDIELPKEIEL